MCEDEGPRGGVGIAEAVRYCNGGKGTGGLSLASHSSSSPILSFTAPPPTGTTGTAHLCVVLKAVNKAIIPDKYPLRDYRRLRNCMPSGRLCNRIHVLSDNGCFYYANHRKLCSSHVTAHAQQEVNLQKVSV